MVCFGLSPGGIYNQHGDIRFVQYLFCFPDSDFPQGSLVIDSGRVDNHYRAQGQQFHPFKYRIGSCTFHRGYSRQILTRYCIDKAGFPNVSFAKKTDMDTFRCRSCIHSHSILS